MGLFKEKSPIGEKIDKLQKEAKEKGIYGKASLIARSLGKKHPRWGIEQLFMEYIFTGEDNGHKIEVIRKEDNVEIYCDGKRVFRETHGGEVWCYRPDISGWLSAITSEFPQAEEAKAEAAKREKEKREEARIETIKDRWGIDLYQYQ